MRISDWSSDVCSSDLRRSRRPRIDRATAIVAVLLGVFLELVTDQFLHLLVVAEQRFETRTLIGELCLLAFDLHFLKLLQVTQLEVKDPFSLRIRQRKDADQFCLGIVLEANDADHLVDRSEEHTSELQSLM